MFVLQTISTVNGNEIRTAFNNYEKYLKAMRNQMPFDAFDFASSAWHYNPEDHRCPHDSWLEQLCVIEPSSGGRSEARNVNIFVKLLGAYHDGWIDLEYTGVVNYSLQYSPSSRPIGVGHGDWLIDEVRLSNTGLVIHEIIFSGGARWLIECNNIKYTWTEKAI